MDAICGSGSLSLCVRCALTGNRGECNRDSNWDKGQSRRRTSIALQLRRSAAVKLLTSSSSPLKAFLSCRTMGVLQQRPQSQPTAHVLHVSRKLVSRQQSGSSDTGSQGFSSVIWLPIIAVFGVIILISVGLYFRRRVRADSNVQSTGTPTAGAQVAEVHAARRRRNRRRASQISTKSLPAYMESAGDEEVVLVRSVAAIVQVTAHVHAFVSAAPVSSSRRSLKA
jgi:hypothetical protein